MDANAEAINAAMRAWSDGLDESQWWAKSAQFDESAPIRLGDSASDPPALPVGSARELTELTEEVLAVMQTVGQQEPVEPTSAEGFDPERRVAVQVGPAGLSSCSIDPEWAARVDGTRVTAALSLALQAARAQVATQQETAPDFNGLLGDALATLRAVTQMPPGGADRGRFA